MTTRVMGTYGYAAPEYITTGNVTSYGHCQGIRKVVNKLAYSQKHDCSTGHLYVNSDVYGFGVVLLEMLTGLRVLDQKRPNGEQNLVEWRKPSLSSKRKLKNIVDARIEGQCTSKAAWETAQLILKCLGSDPKARPPMKVVVDELLKIESLSNDKHSKAHPPHIHQPISTPSRHQ